jgi:hypothetical protein
MLSSGIKPYLYVAEEYSSLLEGISYAEPLVYRGGVYEVSRALKLLRPDVDRVVCQVSGESVAFDRRSWSFARDSWALGSKAPFGEWAPVFDRRDRQRERKLVDSVFPKGIRPFVLVATEGHSTPFPGRKDFLPALEAQLESSFEVVDLSKIKAHRFYDLLGLMDLAHCLVTIDTGTIHLAAASEVPVVALACREVDRWFRAPWRKSEVARFWYEEAVSKVGEIAERVRSARSPQDWPTIYHLWSHFRNGLEESSASERRRCTAMESWLKEYVTGRWRFLPIVDETEGVRVSADVLGDTRRMPMVKDMFAYASEARPEDILCLCNSDLGLVPGITGEILRGCAENGAVFTHRHDFAKVQAPLASEVVCGSGAWYCGTDLFACTKAWWDKHGPEMPDMVFGCEFWDCILRQIVKRSGGGEIHNGVFHEYHASSWCQPDFKSSNPGHLHNLGLATKWFQENKSDQFDPWRKTWNLC